MSSRASALSLVMVPALLLIACGGSQVAGVENDKKLQKNLDGSATGDGQTCTIGGVTVGVGQTFKSPDGCNDCSCAPEGAYCTERACAGDAGGAQQCKGADGKTHEVGDTYPSGDGCNTCSCTANGEACTLRACASDCSAPTSCSGPAPGMPNWTCEDGSTGGPVCEKTASGACGWQIKECVCKDASGTVHKSGETWNDGCNACSCDQQGRVGCTKKACTCPPDGTINCMPPVSPSSASECSGPYHDWIVANCPGVSFVY